MPFLIFLEFHNSPNFSKNLGTARAEVEVLTKTAATLEDTYKTEMLAKLGVKRQEVKALEQQIGAQKEAFSKKVETLEFLVGTLPKVREYRARKKAEETK